MANVIVCLPPPIPSDKLEEAARKAIAINPRNRSAIPEFPVPDDAPPIDRLTVVTRKFWGADGVRLTVGFLDNPSMQLRNKILSHMNAWNQTANVEFTQTEQVNDADVRINRQKTDDDHWNGYWSFLGTDIHVFSGPYNQTMNLEDFSENTPDAEFFRVVRHETGHTLGCPHEHMRADLVAKIDRQKAISYYRRRTGWSEAQVIRQVLTPLDPDSLNATPIADPNSIMAYHVPAAVTIDGIAIAGGTDISPADYNFIASVYPK